jgi:uncharacterized damage-inducible protein DinB
MTYYGGKQLADSFRTVRKNTILVAEDIPQEKFDFAAAPGTRSVEKMLTHIALTPRLQYQLHSSRRKNMEGIDFTAVFQEFKAEEEKPRTKAEIIALLKEEGEKWANLVAELSDEALGETVELGHGATPPAKSRFEMILSVKEHEMHHRAQLMLIERTLGIVPHLTRDMEARWAQMQAAQAQTAQAQTAQAHSAQATRDSTA